MQLHFGCVRNTSSTMFAKLGPDTGYDTINDEGFTAPVLARLLNLLERDGALPRTILYSLNPTDNAVIATVMGAFQTNASVPGKIQMGSAWWFNDHKKGMEQQLTDLMSMGAVGPFVGMLTDSRSFLSYTRHEYFRRILCNLLGTMAEEGEYPLDMELLGERTITIDCDVLQGDGGTRTASVTGGFIALALACRTLVEEGYIGRMPLKHYVAGISAGIVDDTAMLDLQYSEDSRAQVDLNCIMNELGEIIEVQGTGEGRAFTVAEQQELLTLCAKGNRELIAKQKEIVGDIFR